MKERPILFSGPMVRAILEGRKTQTRRVVKPQPMMRDGGDCVVEYRGQKHGGPASYLIGETLPRFGCLYGQPGDRLWVRETWGTGTRCNCSTCKEAPVSYKATYCGELPVVRWRPSIHMPRWASRITLEITGIRVERLQSITDADAIAEGVDSTAVNHDGYASARYMALWESINGVGSWDNNPWVWVVEFKKVDE